MAQKTRPALYTIRQIMFDLVGIDNYTDVKYNDKAGVYYQINLLDEGDTVKLIIRSYDAVWAEAIGELI
jgi:hypothetical protein